MQSYLTMMAVRLLEMRRVMKPTGSVYLHCDPTASHYLKLVMDTVFGASNFKNEIVWKRTAGRSDAKKFGRVHDVLLFYAGPGATWNRQYTAHDPGYVARAYRNRDERGRWRSADLTASGPRPKESGQPWRGIDPGKVGRHWNTPVQGGMNDFIISKGLIRGWPDAYPGVHSRLDALDAAGLIHWPKSGSMPSLKRYLDSTLGTAIEDVFADIGKLEASAKEKIGYPTQKPLALLERIISASSNEGDMVLDPFAGCATALIAAEKLQRQWVGIDLSPKAKDLIEIRMVRDLGLFGLQTIYRDDVPMRTDQGRLPAPTRRTRTRSTVDKKDYVVGAGCYFPFATAPLTICYLRRRAEPTISTTSSCFAAPCNSMKGTKTQEEFIAALRRAGIR